MVVGSSYIMNKMVFIMMAVNAVTADDLLVWGQDATLAANTDYEFSIWVSSWISGSPAIDKTSGAIFA